MEKSGEFQDWEVLQNSDMGIAEQLDSIHQSSDSEDIEGDSEGAIRSDYFTLDSEERYARTVAEGDLCEKGSVESDNPSWVDPCSETRFGDDAMLARKNSGEFWSDSSSERSVSRKFNEFEGKNELGCGDNAKNEVGFEGMGEAEVQVKDFVQSGSNSDRSIPMKFEDVEGENELGLSNHEDTVSRAEFSAELEGKNGSETGGITSFGEVDVLDPSGYVEGERGEVPEVTGNFSREEMNSGEKEKGKMVWWKLPLELLKFCVFRVKPVWPFSIAAAVMGFLILGRRLYKIKRKIRSFPLNVTVEDKKVSQFMTSAARLNEAFSVVRRVPIIRPTQPAAGLTPWPVMSLR